MFSQRLKELRLQRGMTQSELAKYLGVDRTSIGKYETTSTTPDYETLKKIAELFNVSTDYLLGVKEPKLDDLAFALYGEVKDLDEETKKDILNFAKYMRQKRASEKKDKKDS